MRILNIEITPKIRNLILAIAAIATICSSALWGTIFLVSNSESITQSPKPEAVYLTGKVTTAAGVEHSVKLELAISAKERQQGLMQRTSLSFGHGMLFVFERPQPLAFWMKDTLISLDIIFLDTEYRVVNIHKFTQPNQITETYPSSGDAQYVIEVPAGWSDTVGLQPNDQFFIGK